MIDTLVAKGSIPDFLIRQGIRKLLEQRIEEENEGSFDDLEKKRVSLSEELKASPIAIQTDKANDQHYQVPTDFYNYVLGRHKKYSCCYFKNDDESLDTAEANMLETYLEKAEIKEGQKVLDLGCGWGSFGLFAARRFPKSKFTLVSNSKTQREYITNEAEKSGLTNVEVITCDVNNLELNTEFDRIVSIEMFEHMRNYERLLEKLAKHLNEDGKLFVHIFVHKTRSYKYENKDNSDWMSRYFFSGGIMPSEKLLYSFQKDLVISKQWNICGIHYAKTARHWLKNMDNNSREILSLFQTHYGQEAEKWFHYWRVFFMSCEELWKYDEGKEWYVSHYLFEKR